jgi:membrane-associated protease RseP (regulator of RpoE activity)
MPPGAENELYAAPSPAPQRVWLHLLLFVATCFTTYYVGGFFGQENGFSPGAGLAFATSLMSILLAHEMGHYLMARRHGVEASLPYFIPIPAPPIGTFGAVIRMRRPPETRAALLDIGCAGPLAGFVVTVAVCLWGLSMSEVRPLSILPPGAWMEGNSLAYLLFKKVAQPLMGPAEDVWLHPVAWAGWVGLLVTGLNLLPVGQLDGGHIFYALFGEELHRRAGRWLHLVVFLLGLAGLACHMALVFDERLIWAQKLGLGELVVRGSGLSMWLVWTVLLGLVGYRHPPTLLAGERLSTGRKLLGWLSLAVFVLTFTPIVGSPVWP